MYKVVTKKKGVVTILLMNHAQYRKIYRPLSQPAFARRVIFHEIEKTFMRDVNYNLINNITNNLTNSV